MYKSGLDRSVEHYTVSTNEERASCNALGYAHPGQKEGKKCGRIKKTLTYIAGIKIIVYLEPIRKKDDISRARKGSPGPSTLGCGPTQAGTAIVAPHLQVGNTPKVNAQGGTKKGSLGRL